MLNMLDVCINVDGVITKEDRHPDVLYDKLMLFKEAGFEKLDCLCINKNMPHAMYRWVLSFRRALLNTGMSVAQTQMPMLAYITNRKPPVRLVLSELERVRLDMAFRTNVEWGCDKIVVDLLPPKPYFYDFEMKHYLKFNSEYIKWVLETAVKYGVNVCLRTMPPTLNDLECFGTEIKQLQDIYKMVKNEQVMFCVDTESLRLCNKNIPESIRALGSNIGALRLKDSLGVEGQPLLPPFGDIDWDEVALALRDVKYKGALSYRVECDNLGTMNKKALSSYLRYVYELGEGFKDIIVNGRPEPVKEEIDYFDPCGFHY